MKFFKHLKYLVLAASLLIGSSSYAQNATQANSTGSITTNGSNCDLRNTTSCVVLPLPNSNRSYAVFTVSGTWTGTLSFIATNAGLPFSSAVAVIPQAGGASVTSTTGNGSWSAVIAGQTVIAVYGSAAMTGTAVVTITSSTAPISGTITFENAGTGIGVGTVFNCSTNTTCTNSGGVVTITATNTGSTAFSALTGSTNNGGNALVIGTGVIS